MTNPTCQKTQKKLLTNSHFIDYINRQKHNYDVIRNYSWNYFKAPSRVKNEIRNLYKDDRTREISIQMLYKYFREQYNICLAYLPPDDRSSIVYDVINYKPCQLVHNLLSLLKTIYNFDTYIELHSD